MFIRVKDIIINIDKITMINVSEKLKDHLGEDVEPYVSIHFLGKEQPERIRFASLDALNSFLKRINVIGN